MRIVIAILLMLFAAPAFAEDTPAARCEALAGHPFEPGHNGVGVESDAINAPAAMEACAAALEAAPGDLATRYRLSRALIRLGACEDGLSMQREVAEAGYPSAEGSLGANYLNEVCGLPHDLEAAFLWSSRAAFHGNAVGQSNLGYLYQCGCVEQRNYAEAAKWYRAAAEQGYPTGLLNYGTMLQQGKGVPQDLEEAKRVYRKAAALGEGTAAARLAHMILYPESRSLSLAEITDAMALLDKAVSEGSIYALIELGRWEDANGNYERATELWESCYNSGYAVCPYELGIMAELGHGQPVDPVKALGFYNFAADLGLPEAMLKVGRFYMRGTGVQADPGRGEEWFLKAAAYGNADAMIEVADYYRNEAQKPDQAIRFYRMAAEEFGSLDAYTRLAEYYGMMADFDKAYAYGGVVMERGEPWRKLEMQSLFDALGRMQRERGLVDAPPPSPEPVG